jgi:2-polyprenyl-3-methyl-5-hydroxy-6-metoxy-1,4-benzoquinol methylase
MAQDSNPLSADSSEKRYAEERRQGAALLSCGWEEAAWGWSGPAGTIRATRRSEFLIRECGLRAGVTCLELGCGTGEFTTRLLASGCTLSAVELSEATAAVCRKRTEGKAEIIVGNIETGEGLRGRAFDAIAGVSVLHHVNMDLCLKNTFALLKPGGRFAFSEPNMSNPQIWAERHIGFVKKWRHVTEHETAFRSKQLRQLFEGAGLTVTVCEPFEFLHPSTPGFCMGAVKLVERMIEATPLRAFAGSIRISGRSGA